MSIVGPRLVRGAFLPFGFWFRSRNHAARNLLLAVRGDT